MVSFFRYPLSKLISFSPATAIFLILVFSSVRMALVFTAAKSGNYQFVGLIFLLMILFTLAALNRSGYRQIGLRKISLAGLLVSLGLGILCSFVMGVTGWLLSGDSLENWFVYISTSYANLPEQMDATSRFIYFVVFASIGMSFSPLGEEFFYRGIIHECFRATGEMKASLIDASAFSIVHLAHFGIIWNGTHWQFLLIPSIVWLILLFFTCLIFSYCRRKFMSLWGAVGAHAGYNLMMNFTIFYFIL